MKRVIFSLREILNQGLWTETKKWLGISYGAPPKEMLHDPESTEVTLTAEEIGMIGLKIVVPEIDKSIFEQRISVMSDCILRARKLYPLEGIKVTGLKLTLPEKEWLWKRGYRVLRQLAEIGGTVDEILIFDQELENENKVISKVADK